MRLDKFVCKSTALSRAEVSNVLQNHQVKVDNKVFTNGAVQIHENNTVSLDDRALTLRPFRYLLMHKPPNTLCSNIDENYPSIFNYIDIDHKSELHIVGRLDADTTGLVLITDDGSWTFNIIKPEAQCNKVYRVQLRDELTEEAVSRLEQGVLLQGTEKVTLPAKIQIHGSKEVLLTITEGRFHQVKRMFRAVGNRVKGLHREQIGQVALDVDLGQWRYLSEAEVASFY
ncbi:MAG: 16S rRNA pseudouridine516 synthase [Oleiphilaceae bacterium]|jgi:16S rRNA pseudouridine516 synthase